MTAHTSLSFRSRQTGAVLFVSMILLLVLTLIGVTAARMQMVEERIARNDVDHQLALQSAEAVLRHSEAQFWNSNATYSADAFDGTNGRFSLSTEAASGSSIADQDPSAFTSQSIDYDGPTLSGVPAGVPKYVVENLPPATFAAGGIPASGSSGTTIRTTTLATGADANSYAKVQSIAHK